MKKYNIALIDDDRVGLDSVKLCLENDLKDSANIFVFTLGRKFIQEMAEKDFHLIVTDLEMPDINGVDIVNYVKKYHQNIPVIVLTGNQDILRSNFEIRKQIFEVFIKPVEYKQLLRTIKDGLACTRFMMPASEERAALNDSSADTRLIDEISNINHEIHRMIVSVNYEKNQIVELLDNQEKLIKVLKDKAFPD